MKLRLWPVLEVILAAQGTTQAALAGQLSQSTSTLRGQVAGNPRLSTLLRISETLDVPLWVWLRDSESDTE